MAATVAPESAPKKGKASAKAPKATKSKGEKEQAGRPTSAAMIVEAITKLNDKGGTSLQAIKKYIADVHQVDLKKQGGIIRKALVKAVESGTLTQLKGKGASGSFKLAVKPKPAKKAAGEEHSASSPVKKAVKKPVGKKLAGSLPMKAAKVAAKPKGNVKKAEKPAPSKGKPATKPAAAKKAPAKPKAAKVKLPKTLKTKSPAKPKGKNN